jgi:hypothetical protein
MNTAQIKSALQTHPITRPIFRGVFASDGLPTALASLPGAFVINTDPSNMPGMHWVAVFSDKEDEIEIFDSFGKDFSFYGLKPLSRRVIKQTEQLQSSDSTVCGQYCLFFLLRRASGETYKQIIQLFTENKVSNDKMVCQYINHFFELSTKVHDDKFLKQVAKTFSQLN